MTLPQIDDDQLQRYFDGELPAAEADAVREAIEASEDQRARIEQLARLRRLLRLAAEDVAGDVASDELYGRIRTGMAAEQRRGGLRVIEGNRRRRRAIVGIGVTVALAAAVLFAVLRGAPDRSPPPVAHERVGASGERTVVASNGHGAHAGAGDRGEGSEVLEVDFGRNTGTVFNIQGSSGQPIAVVWINDEGEVQ